MLARAALAAALVAGYGLLTRWGPALADEYVYLSGAHHFALTGSLDARFYDVRAILARGHPHQDVHSPGYVILLGALTAVVGGGYGTAVGLNAAAFVASSLLVFVLARTLGLDERAAGLAGTLYLVLPVYLPFVFWAMPEVLLGTLFLAALVLAARGSDRTWAAVASGLVFGLGLLVRESLVFGLPAILVCLRDARRRSAFLATVALFVVCIHVPLSRQRAPGGVNFWSTPADVRRPGGFAPWHAARDGEVGPRPGQHLAPGGLQRVRTGRPQPDREGNPRPVPGAGPGGGSASALRKPARGSSGYGAVPGLALSPALHAHAVRPRTLGRLPVPDVPHARASPLDRAPVTRPGGDLALDPSHAIRPGLRRAPGGGVDHPRQIQIVTAAPPGGDLELRRALCRAAADRPHRGAQRLPFRLASLSDGGHLHPAR
jgi:hypothetical protein